MELRRELNQASLVFAQAHSIGHEHREFDHAAACHVRKSHLEVQGARP
jgi:hypothetical protein